MQPTTRKFLAGFFTAAASVCAATNEPTTTFWQRPALLGELGGIRPTLQTNGVECLPTYTGEIMGEATGNNRGNRFIYDQVFNLPLNVNLDQLAGWTGASFHANVFWFAGDSLTEDCIGDLANVSNISAPPSVRLQELWLQQKFWGDLVSIRAGALAVDSEFIYSAASALFINSSFGTFPLAAANLPNPAIYPYAAPAIRLAIQPNPRFSFMAGIYDGNVGSTEDNEHGLNFHLAQGDGALIFSELGLNLHPAADEKSLAGMIKTGSFLHTKRVQTWQGQLAGNPAAGSINWGFYGMVEHDLYRQAAQKITAFARGGGAPSDRNVIGWYFDAGLTFTGFLPGRENDVAGIAFARSTFSQDFSDYQQAVNGTCAYDSEMVIEATYTAQITPWWILQPDLQIILTPGGEKNRHTAVVLGLRTTVNF